MKIVVIGGTGLIGSKVVDILTRDGNEVFAAVPSTGVDTVTGEGLDRALDGAEIVVAVSTSPWFDAQPGLYLSLAAGRNIVAAATAAGVRHHVALSVVGTERLLESGYFRAKLAQEQMIAASPIPWTLVRATQFFEFLRGIADNATRDDAVRLPPARFQPMAAHDVSAAVAGAAIAPPTNAMHEVAGPEVFRLDELIARVLRHDGDPRQVIADPAASYFGIIPNDTSLMPGPEARLASTSFEWWIANVPPPPKK